VKKYYGAGLNNIANIAINITKMRKANKKVLAQPRVNGSPQLGQVLASFEILA